MTHVVAFYISLTSIKIVMSEFKEITKTFLTGKQSATLVIPIEIARRKGLEKPAHVVIEERPEGILIKKLEIW
jgi:hypothetical protein